MASTQVIFSEVTGTGSTAGTWYHPIVGDYAVWNVATNGFTNSPWSVAGTFHNMVVNAAAPGSGKTAVLTVFKNGVATDLAVTLSGAEMTGRDTTHSVTVAPGDKIGLQYDPSGGLVDLGYFEVSYEFESTNDGESGYTHASLTTPDTAATNYLGPFGSKNWRAAEVDALNVIPIAGSITRIDVLLNGTAGTAGNGYTYALVLDGVVQDGTGATTDTTVDVLGTATSGYGTFSLSVTAGQTVSLASIPVGTPSERYAGVGVCFAATAAGEFIVASHPTDAQSKTATEYNFPSLSGTDSWLSVETSRDLYGSVTSVSLSRFYAVLSLAPGAGGSGDQYTYSVRRNAGSPTGTPSVTVSETATTGNDTSGSVTIADGDTWSMRCVPANTPANAPNVSWAMRGIACAWVDIANHIPVPIDFDQYPGGTARVYCHLWSADSGVPVKARLYDGSTSLGESEFVTATTPTSTQFAVSGSGTKTVRLQIYGNKGANLFCKSGGLIV